MNEIRILNDRLVITIGDISRHSADAIVNAASHFMVGMDGCSGAVLSAGGEGLLQECIKLGGCEEGDAKVTGGYQLPARWVIHAVAPVWHNGVDGEEARLVRCYHRCFELAEGLGCQTLAFPSLGTGGHACPLPWATRIAVREITACLEKYPSFQQVTVMCYEEETLESYRENVQQFS